MSRFHRHFSLAALVLLCGTALVPFSAAAQAPSAEQSAVLADRDGLNTIRPKVRAWEGSFTSFWSQIYSTTRDRFLQDPFSSSPLVRRRVAWRYPQDGSSWRVEAFNRNLAEAYRRQPLQTLFVFGNLSASSEHSGTGPLRWSYYTAPVIRIDDVVRVIDPALSSNELLRLEDWLMRLVDAAPNPMHERGLLKVAVCSPSAVVPTAACEFTGEGDVPSGMTDEEYKTQTDTYLRAEWANELSLGRDPYSTLLN